MLQKMLAKLLVLERTQNKFFNALLKINELYIKFYFRSSKYKLTEFSTKILTSQGENYLLKILNEKHLDKLQKFFKYEFSIHSKEYFIPHKTDKLSLKRLIRNNSYLVLGVFHEDHLIGYALVTLFFPRKGLYAIFIADKWQGKGIGTAVLREQLRLIHYLKFKPLSAVNKRNLKSIKMLKKLVIKFKKDIGDSIIVTDMCKQTQTIG